MKSRNGVVYDVANGEGISNLGEKRCVLATDSSEEAVPITMHACDGHKSLASIGKMVKAWRAGKMEVDTMVATKKE